MVISFSSRSNSQRIESQVREFSFENAWIFAKNATKLRVSICQMQKGSESLIVLSINWVAGN